MKIKNRIKYLKKIAQDSGLIGKIEEFSSKAKNEAIKQLINNELRKHLKSGNIDKIIVNYTPAVKDQKTGKISIPVCIVNLSLKLPPTYDTKAVRSDLTDLIEKTILNNRMIPDNTDISVVIAIDAK